MIAAAAALPTWVTVALVLVTLVLGAAHLALELRQRDVHLRWTDRRDVEFAALFEHAWVLVMIPKSNPMPAYKQHGMLSKQGVEALPLFEERLEELSTAATIVAKAAKSLRSWELQNPPPPLHYWEAWQQAWRSRRAPARLSGRNPDQQRLPRGKDGRWETKELPTGD